MTRKKHLSIQTGVMAVCLCLLALGLLINAPAVSAGIKRGLSVSAGVLVPSLFPFMVLCGFLSMTDYGRVISLPFGWLTEKLFRLPREWGYVVLLSMIGGYPVGARMIATLRDQNRASQDTARRMLCFCVNAGPSFLITAVGAGMFLDRKAGLILFGTQITASILLGFLTARRARPIEGGRVAPAKTGQVSAFVLSVTGAASSLIGLCAFATLFAGLLELVSSSEITAAIAGWFGVESALPDALLAGLFEVTTGCIAAAKIGGLAGFGLASCFLSFSGISVIFQVLSFFRDDTVRIKSFLVGRLLHMGISTALALPLYRLLCGATSAMWTTDQPPALQGDGKALWITLCFLGMCIVMTLSAGKSRWRS
jgi:sporulation integral membrane protein YlbJ